MRGNRAVAAATPGAELRAAISRPSAYRAIAATGQLDGILSGDIGEHIHAVYDRLELAAGDQFVFAAPLRLSVLVHEEPPERLPALLEHLGVSDMAPLVTQVVSTFGRLWKLSSDDEARDFASGHRAHLAPLLLFELAHEGAPTPAMRWIARLGGLESDFERWVDRLEGRAVMPGGGGRL